MIIKIYYNLDSIKKIVEELMPPKNNHLIGCFKLEFLISSSNWDYTADQVEITNTRGFSYVIKRATIAQEIDILKSMVNEYYEYTDIHEEWKQQVELRKRIKQLEDENQVWILQQVQNISL